MDAKDLYREVQILYAKNTSIGMLFPGEKVKFQDYAEMLYDYTSRKLLEAHHDENLVDDLGLMFDRLDGCFQSEQEKEAFYQIYVHCLLNYYNDIVDGVALWQVEQYPEEGVCYPRFKKDEFLTFFQTLEGQSHKDIALWLWDELRVLAERKEEEKKESKEKGSVYQKLNNGNPLWNK